MFSDMKPPILLVFWFFLYPTIDLFNSLVQYFIWNHRCFQLSLYFLKWNRSFFFAILRMVFIKMKLSMFQLFVFAIWNYFPHVFVFVHMKRPIFSICFMFSEWKNWCLYIFVFSYETHDSLISLCLCICNHRFVFFHLKTIDVRICCVCCPCETIDFVFLKNLLYLFIWKIVF